MYTTLDCGDERQEEQRLRNIEGKNLTYKVDFRFD